MKVRTIFFITGTVQGVGFRPFVFNLAKKYGLFGFVQNTTQGVAIDTEGPARAIRAFERELKTPPPSARIENIKTQPLALKKYRDFRIMESARGIHATLAIPPDLDVCNNCARELFDKNDRRFRYPFINCTNCGLRFTIVERAPYDRTRTTMRTFTMCRTCAQEYKDPANRRFHAEPNACPKCGPKLFLKNTQGEAVPCADAIVKTEALIKKGSVVGILGVGGFHLICRADSEKTVARLRMHKHRPHKPLAIMVNDITHAKQFAHISPEETRLLESPQKPVVLLLKKERTALAKNIAPNNANIGIMLPYAPLHHLLMRELDIPVVATSGNRSGDPIICDPKEGLEKLSDIADYFLIHNRPINNRCDDSVVQWNPVLKRIIFVRRARGFVPLPIHSPFPFTKKILATGGQMKNVFAVAHHDNTVLSQHIGELEHADTANFFTENTVQFEKLLGVQPSIIARDMHPDYFTTRWARKQEKMKIVSVQHHHAHFASCLFDNKIPQDKKTLGVIWDGTGYGMDGTIWGGEFLYGGYDSAERIAHLKQFSLPGGEQAIREPWRIITGILDDMGVTPASAIAKKVVAAKRNHINSPACSSAGRLFDAVSALLGVRTHTTYEAQAAIELESLALKGKSAHSYPFTVDTAHSPWQIDFHPMISAILADMAHTIKKETIAYRFHLTMAEIITEVSTRAAQEYKTKTVALSGGVFQNSLLLGLVWRKLVAQKLTPLFHRSIPPNDGGLAVGQAAVASALTDKTHRVALLERKR